MRNFIIKFFDNMINLAEILEFVILEILMYGNLSQQGHVRQLLEFFDKEYFQEEVKQTQIHITENKVINISVTTKSKRSEIDIVSDIKGKLLTIFKDFNDEYNTHFVVLMFLTTISTETCVNLFKTDLKTLRFETTTVDSDFRMKKVSFFSFCLLQGIKVVIPRLVELNYLIPDLRDNWFNYLLIYTTSNPSPEVLNNKLEVLKSLKTTRLFHLELDRIDSMSTSDYVNCSDDFMVTLIETITLTTQSLSYLKSLNKRSLFSLYRKSYILNIVLMPIKKYLTQGIKDILFIVDAII
jgi:hypothetical protein